jgi:hypothetical protein
MCLIYTQLCRNIKLAKEKRHSFFDIGIILLSSRVIALKLKPLCVAEFSLMQKFKKAQGKNWFVTLLSLVFLP